MDGRPAARRRARGGEGIPKTRTARAALILGAASVVLAVTLTAWLISIAGPIAQPATKGLGATALLVLLVTLAIGRPEPIVITLALLGAAYAVIVAIDDPPLDGRSVIVGAALLTVGELAHLSIQARVAVTPEAGALARRVASVAVLALGAVAVGAVVLALVDLLPTGGVAVEVVGVAAALGIVGLLVVAARDARSGSR